MKSGSVASTSILSSVLLGAAVMLLLATAYLYQNNRSVKQQNRELIIQNDSIISVNIELKQELERRETKPLKGASLTSKASVSK